METIFNFFGQYTCVMYLFSFMFMSYLVATYFSNLFKIKTVFIVLIIATILAVPFLIWDYECSWQKILLSYAIGTSLHETCFKWIAKAVAGVLKWADEKIDENLPI